MKIKTEKLTLYSLLLFLILCSIGSVFTQVISIISFGLIMVFVKGVNYNEHFIVFYMTLIIISALQLFFIWREDYSIPYLVNSLLITLMWILSLLAHNFIIYCVRICSLEALNKLLNWFFWLNIILVILQYFLICIESKSLIPFSIPQYGMSTGDYLKGFFSNSSVNMIIMSFYSVYYLMLKDKVKTVIAIVASILTTYMSGILIALAICSLYAFFMFKLKKKIVTTLVIIIGFSIFSVISPENINYIKHIFTEKINSKTDPVRKLVSFEQTLSNFTSNPQIFLLGEGGGKFSSRTAYLTGGEYVDWYPLNLVYKSNSFEKNHFKLWNYEALSIAFKDGTANQPFSFYNKIIGEYGFIGLSLFIIYISYFFKKYRYLTYGKFILLFLIGFLVLDYWFEYFTVIIFFELFLFIDIKKRKNLTNNERFKTKNS